jgi:hypothetical protein
MATQLEELTALTGYRFRLWEYHVSHSVLTIRGTGLHAPRKNVHLHFAEVYYVQLPTTWEGDFELGSDAEFSDIAGRAGLKGPYEVHMATLSLFKSGAGNNAVYILGTLISLEHDVGGGVDP